MEPDRVDALLARGLDAVEVEAPIAEGMDAVRRRRGSQRRRHRGMVAMVAAIVLGLGVTFVVADDDPQQLSTDLRPPTTTVPPSTSAPGPTGAVVLDPQGPYRDGDPVNLRLIGSLPDDLSNDPPRLCATTEGRETCDPLWVGSFFQARLPQLTFTAAGWRDCADPQVDCRIAVNGADGRLHRSERLEFVGAAPEPAVGLSVAAPDGGSMVTDTAVLQPVGLKADPSWATWRDELEDAGTGLTAFVGQVCAFLPAPGTYDCDLLSYFWSIDPDDADAEVRLSVRREIFGFGGWQDCDLSGCFVLIRATRVSSVSRENGTYADDVPVAAAPITFDPTAAPAARPSLRVEGGPTVAIGADITVHVDDLPDLDGETVELGLCHQDPTQTNDCGYLTVTDGGSIPVDDVVRVTLSAPAFGVEACERDGCFLALLIGQEGSPPLAVLPIEVRA